MKLLIHYQIGRTFETYNIDNNHMTIFDFF